MVDIPESLINLDVEKELKKMKDNPRKGLVLYSLWLTKLEEERIIYALKNMPMIHLQGDSLNSYMEMIDIIRGIYSRGDLHKWH